MYTEEHPIANFPPHPHAINKSLAEFLTDAETEALFFFP